MTVDEGTIRNLCTTAVFERGQKYRNEGRIQRINRFDDAITAVVQGSSQYDVTIRQPGITIDAQCTCPYAGASECKYVVAVFLDVAADPPRDESGHVEPVLHAVPADALQTFVRDALAKHPDLREQFLARFGDTARSVEEYRADIERRFDRQTQDYPVVTDAIDFSHFFDLAERYRERERYVAAATVYRAFFEEIDDNMDRIDAAYDHYAKSIRSALDGYVDCVLATDPDPEELDTYAGVLEEQAMSMPTTNEEQFRQAIEDLDDR